MDCKSIMAPKGTSPKGGRRKIREYPISNTEYPREDTPLGSFA